MVKAFLRKGDTVIYFRHLTTEKSFQRSNHSLSPVATVARNKYSRVLSSLCTQTLAGFPLRLLSSWPGIPPFPTSPPENQNRVILPCAQPLPCSPTWSDPPPSLPAPLPGAGTPAGDRRSSQPPSSKGDFLSKERKGTGLREAPCSEIVSMASHVPLTPQSMCGFCKLGALSSGRGQQGKGPGRRKQPRPVGLTAPFPAPVAGPHRHVVW